LRRLPANGVHLSVCARTTAPFVERGDRPGRRTK
jgi:hypothetical protein